MAAHFTIAGRVFHRRSTVKLSAGEKAELAVGGVVVVRRGVEWPLADREAWLDRGRVDPGGTDIWGPGPYLKVPNRHPLDGEEVENRVFCPWGYPPDRVRVAWSSCYLELVRVELVRGEGGGGWEWVLTLRRV